MELSEIINLIVLLGILYFIYIIFFKKTTSDDNTLSASNLPIENNYRPPSVVYDYIPPTTTNDSNPTTTVDYSPPTTSNPSSEVKEKYCPSGYFNNGDKCIKVIDVKNKRNPCPDGYTNLGLTCYKKLLNFIDAPACNSDEKKIYFIVIKNVI